MADRQTDIKIEMADLCTHADGGDEGRYRHIIFHDHDVRITRVRQSCYMYTIAQRYWSCLFQRYYAYAFS